MHPVPIPIPRAEDLLQRHVATVSPDTSLADLMKFFDQHRVANAPVVEPDEHGQPVMVGFVSEGDCLEHLSNEIFFGAPAPPQTARTMMKRHPVCVELDTDIFTLASIFVSHRHRCLPVVEGSRLQGVVHRHDVLYALDRFYRQEMQQHDAERFPRNLHEIANLRFVARS